VDVRRRLRSRDETPPARGAEAEEREFYDRRATPEWKEAIRPIGTDWVKTHITDAPYVVVVFEQPWRWEDGRKVKHYQAARRDPRERLSRHARGAAAPRAPAYLSDARLARNQCDAQPRNPSRHSFVTVAATRAVRSGRVWSRITTRRG